jgi:NaMN:DMB phosphoribosyltransferase
VLVRLFSGCGTDIINDVQLAHRIEGIKSAVVPSYPNTAEPVDVLGKVGGLEIVGLVTLAVVLAEAGLSGREGV